MRQYLLLSILALWQCFAAVAGTVSFSPSSVNWQANTHAEYGAGYLWGGVEGLEVGLYKATSAYSVTPGTGSYLKVRQNQVMEIATLQGQMITKIVVNYQTPKYTSSIYFGQNGDDSRLIEASGTSTTWEGNATRLKMKFSKDCNLVSVEVTYEGEVKEQVAKPVCTPASGTYFEPFEWTATTSTEGATLLYSVNGDEFTTYTGPLTISEGCTIDVKGVKDGAIDSETVSFSYAFRPLTDVSSIAQAKEYMDTEEVVRFVNPVVVTFQNNIQYYTYVRDETGCLLIYGMLPKYANGDVMRGGFYGKMVNDHGMLKLVTMVDVDVKTNASFPEAQPGEGEVEPVLIDKTANVSTEMQSQYVAFNYVLFDQGNEDVNPYISNGTRLTLNNYFGIEYPENGMYSVTGIISVWNDVVELYPIAFSTDPIVTNIDATPLSGNTTKAVYTLDGKRVANERAGQPGVRIVHENGRSYKVLKRN